MIGFGRNFRFLMGVGGSLVLVEFGGFLRLVESGRFFGRGVDISGNLREFFRFWFRVKAVHYRAFLLVIRGSK